MTSKAARRRQHKASRKVAKATTRGRSTTASVTTERDEPRQIVRRVLGLDWLLNKGRIDREQYLIGKRLGEVCSERQRADMPAKGGEGGAPGVNPNQWPNVGVLQAVAEYGQARKRVLEPFDDPKDGEAMWTLLEAVCRDGYTVASLANDRWDAIKLEERLKVGLAFLRYLVRSDMPKAA